MSDQMEVLRRTVAELTGEDPESWPEHRNAPLAIAATVALLVRRSTTRSPVHYDGDSARAAAAAAKRRAESLATISAEPGPGVFSFDDWLDRIRLMQLDWDHTVVLSHVARQFRGFRDRERPANADAEERQPSAVQVGDVRAEYTTIEDPAAWVERELRSREALLETLRVAQAYARRHSVPEVVAALDLTALIVDGEPAGGPDRFIAALDAEEARSSSGPWRRVLRRLRRRYRAIHGIAARWPDVDYDPDEERDREEA